MAKKVTGFLKLQVPAGKANPSPPIGPALGQRGLNIMEFCKAFNAQTQKLEKGTPIPVTITVFADRSFSFEMRQPPMSHFLKKAAKLELTSVPYKGEVPILSDLLNGALPFAAVTIPFIKEQIKAGKVRALGVTSRLPVASLPGVPSIAQSGVPEYEAVPYYTMSASSKVPPELVRKLNADLETVIRLPELAPRWTELGITVLGGPPDAAIKRNAVETATWTRVIKAAGMRAD